MSVIEKKKVSTMAKKSAQQSAAVSAKSAPVPVKNQSAAVPTPARAMKAPPVVPVKPGAGEVGGDDPAEKRNRVPMDVFINRYLESQADENMTWERFAETWSMNVGTAQVALQNAKGMLRKLGYDKEAIKIALPPFKSREHGSRESTGKALEMLLGRLSGWNAGSK